MYQALFVFCAILSCNVSFGRSFDTSTELEKINKNLVEKVPHSDDLNENTSALKQMLDRESKFNVFDIDYRKTLEKLNYVAENKCDKTTVDYFELIDKSLNYEPRKREPIKRVAKVVRKLLIRHAEICPKVYQTTFQSKLASLDREKVGYVDTLIDNLYDLSQSSKSLYGSYIGSNSDFYWRSILNWSDHMRGIHKALQTDLKGKAASKDLLRVEDEIAGTRAANEEKLKEIFSQYLITPCKYYVDELGPEVFVPAKYDSKMHHVVDETESAFYQSWFKYKFCGKLLSDQSFVLKRLIR